MKKKIDPLGRLGIPKYIRKDMNLDENSTVLIQYIPEEKEIRIKKEESACSLCGCHTDLIPIGQERLLCKACLESIKRNFGSV